MINYERVQGDRVRLITLPAHNAAARAAWRAFTESDTVLGLDIESFGIEELGTYSRSVKTRMVQFGNKAESWAFDVTDLNWRNEVETLLGDHDRRFVSHNAAFDATRVLYEYGIELGERSIDTLPMACLLWPGRTAPKGRGLKELCEDYVDGGLLASEHALHARFMDDFTAQKPRRNSLLPKGFEAGVSPCRQARKKGEAKCERTSWPWSKCGLCDLHYRERKISAEAKTWGWSHIALTDPDFSRYAGLDAIYVRRLLDVLAAKIRRAKMGTLSRTEQRVKRLMVASSVRGQRVDLGWAQGILAEVEGDFLAAEESIADLTGGLKARSPKLKPWLAERGLAVTSLDKDHLPDLVERHGDKPEVGPVLRQLGVISEHSNLLSNLRTIELHARVGDGFVHSSVNTQQAHTGRMSYTDPAMQTLAKNGLKGERLRGCFVARDGYTLVGADYDSQEIRLAAALSRDPMLCRIVAEDLNQHVETAKSIFADFKGKKDDPDRYHQAKTLDFAQQYGAGPKKIAKTLGITETEALALWQGWRQTYAGLVYWTDLQGRKRFVVNPFGRIIPTDEFRNYANGNYLVQSSGRDVLGVALVRLDDEGYGQNIWMTVHDEIVLEVPVEQSEQAALDLGRCMTMDVLDVPITATGEVIGPRWKGLS